MSYTDSIIESVIKKNPNEPEFIQAVTEVMNQNIRTQLFWNAL